MEIVLNNACAYRTKEVSFRAKPAENTAKAPIFVEFLDVNGKTHSVPVTSIMELIYD